MSSASSSAGSSSPDRRSSPIRRSASAARAASTREHSRASKSVEPGTTPTPSTAHPPRSNHIRILFHLPLSTRWRTLGCRGPRCPDQRLRPGGGTHTLAVPSTSRYPSFEPDPAGERWTPLPPDSLRDRRESGVNRPLLTPSRPVHVRSSACPRCAMVQTKPLVRCPGCESRLIYPLACEQLGTRVILTRRCPECELSRRDRDHGVRRGGWRRRDARICRQISAYADALARGEALR